MKQKKGRQSLDTLRFLGSMTRKITFNMPDEWFHNNFNNKVQCWLFKPSSDLVPYLWNAPEVQNCPLKILSEQYCPRNFPWTVILASWDIEYNVLYCCWLWINSLFLFQMNDTCYQTTTPPLYSMDPITNTIESPQQLAHMGKFCTFSAHTVSVCTYIMGEFNIFQLVCVCTYIMGELKTFQLSFVWWMFLYNEWVDHFSAQLCTYLNMVG